MGLTCNGCDCMVNCGNKDTVQLQAQGRCMSRLWGPLLGTRTASPDAAGALADLQVRRHHWDSVTRHVQDEWPAVQTIRCSFSGMRPTLNIYITSWSEESRFRHCPLADWLRETLGLDRCEIHVLPHRPTKVRIRGIQVYPKFSAND